MIWAAKHATHVMATQTQRSMSLFHVASHRPRAFWVASAFLAYYIMLCHVILYYIMASPNMSTPPFGGPSPLSCCAALSCLPAMARRNDPPPAQSCLVGRCVAVARDTRYYVVLYCFVMLYHIMSYCVTLCFAIIH
jgi:hypothetical protein